jgi:hypothetical protein
MPFFCISKYVNLLYNAIQASQMTKVKFHCSQTNVLNKICTQKQNGTKFHCQSLHMANILKKKKKKKREGE